MLNFFKSNNPGVVIAYIIYLVLFRVCFRFFTPDVNFVFDYHEPLSKLVFNFLKGLPFQYLTLSLVLSAVLSFVQALIVNYIVNEHKIVQRNNYLPGVFFIIFSSFFKESLLLSPASIALTFMLVCAGKIFSLSRKEKAYGDVFDSGFLVAVATLFYFPSIVFIIFAYIGLGSIRAFTYREWAITLLGFACPFFLCFTGYYWYDSTPRMWMDISNTQQKGWLVGINHFKQTDYLLLGALILNILAALAFLPSALYSSLIQVRKYSTTLVFFIFLVGISFSLQQKVSLSHFTWMALPLSIIYTMVTFRLKADLASEIIHLMLILLVLAGQYLPIFNLI